MKLKVNDVILFTFLLPNLVFPLFFPPLKSVIGNNRKEEGEMRKRGDEKEGWEEGSTYYCSQAHRYL